MKRDFWTEWRGDLQGRVVMQIKQLCCVFGWRVDLHRFVDADAPECFHTHPSLAFRVVLWGGYVEELEGGRLRIWRPGMAGVVRPELSHRVASLRNGRSSWSLWIRGPKCARIELLGVGWNR